MIFFEVLKLQIELSPEKQDFILSFKKCNSSQKSTAMIKQNIYYASTKEWD